MKKVARSNCKVFNDSTTPLYVIPVASPIIQYQALTLSVSGTTLWTPASGKSIYLTAISCSSLLNLSASVNFTRASGIFLTIFSTPYVQSFASPVVFNVNEPIAVSSPTLTIVMNITLFGYEQ